MWKNLKDEHDNVIFVRRAAFRTASRPGNGHLLARLQRLSNRRRIQANGYPE